MHNNVVYKVICLLWYEATAIARYNKQDIANYIAQAVKSKDVYNTIIQIYLLSIRIARLHYEIKLTPFTRC